MLVRSGYVARRSTATLTLSQRCSTTLWRLVFANLDRKFSRAIVRPLLTIENTVIGCLFGRHFVAISVPEM